MDRNLRYDWDSKTLFLPDGSRFTLGEQLNPTVFLDRNGNKRVFSPTSGIWTDSLGRPIRIPFTGHIGPGSLVPQSPGDYPYQLPG
jgi:hypothetical protein